MLTVTIPAALRPQVGDQEKIELEAANVGEALEKLAADFPEFGKKLFQAPGRLNRFVNCYLNDEDIRFIDNLDSAVKAGDELAIIPAIAGG